MANIFEPSYIWKFIPQLLAALPRTLEMTAVAAIGGLVLGFLIAIVKIKKIPVLYQICNVFVSFMRGTPLLVQLFLAYYGLPIVFELLDASWGWNVDVNSIPAIAFVFMAFSLNEGAYNSETIRAAISSVDKNEVEAAVSVGMTNFQAMRRVTIPQALLVALPNFGNSLVSLIKNTSIAFTVSVMDIMAAAKVACGRNLRFFEAYIAAAIIYWIVCIIMEIVFKRIETALNYKRKSNVKSSRLEKKIAAMAEA